MSLLRKIFQFSKTNPTPKEDDAASNEAINELENKPVDEKFAINFKNNGGKFLYCESMDEAFENFENIVYENKWEHSTLLCLDKALKEKFAKSTVKLSAEAVNADCFLATCEFLVADTGAILFSSEQITEKNIKEFPDYLIVFATTSQFVKTISDGLQGIKMKHPNRIPSNITTIKNFETPIDDNFMTYGSSSKKLYLLLLEDL
ncbi:LUD domain-containing protein [Neptunitalea lumnitzerae]|uniref:LUD domain-containing protein n=1 Tax=Neptunitalea lumnitzerae TaxID=2965509 RepID=A0ABQ5MNF3_9FLAO|nr:LUD domain-containing protein [Neptunitalea sp. Y10]GLB50883.1 hypothetical protein Y10_32510 [Neptunitalea sp. Y10]